MITTTEILKSHAPEFVALDEAERKAEAGPWIRGGSSGRIITRPDGYFGDGFLADVDLPTNSDLICEARNKTRLLLDAYAQTLSKLTQITQERDAYRETLIKGEWPYHSPEYNRSLDARISELTDRLAERDWKPRDTAPQDGTNFLSLNRNQGNLMSVTWFSRVHEYFCATGGQHLYQFTHWQPLPPAVLEEISQ